MVATMNKYLIVIEDRNCVLTKEGTWIETAFADEELKNDELMEFADMAVGQSFVLRSIMSTSQPSSFLPTKFE